MTTPTEMRRLILETEALLFERFDATADPAEKQSLRTQIETLNRLKDQVNFGAALARANALNDLSDLLAAAIAGVRSQPFNGIGGRLEALLARVGDQLRALREELRSELAEEAAESGFAAAVVAAPAPAGDAAAAAMPVAVAEAPVRAAPAAPSATIDSTDFAGLKPEYETLFASCAVRPERLREVARLAERIVANAAVYKDVGDAANGVPWYFIGIIHALECNFDFDAHLHNGDPLSARTVRHPPGRPAAGAPPFRWKESALDALSLHGYDRETDWSLPRMLFLWEKYNGFGYRRRRIATPYLWSFSGHYEKGKFTRDGHFDPEFVSKQCGAAVILKQLVNSGAVTLDAATGTLNADVALALQSERLAAVDGAPFAHAQAELRFPGPLARRAKGDAVRRVQEWCSFHGHPTTIDGDFGPGTERAVRSFQTAAGLAATGTVDEQTWAALTAPMRRALAPIEPNGRSLHAMVLAVAAQHLGEHPVEIGGDNRGPWVRLYMRGQEGKEQKWCAGFVCTIIEQAVFALGEPMPLKRRVGVDQLVADAKRDGRFLAEADLHTAAARTSRIPGGSLFVLRDKSNDQDWIHTGLVTEAGGDSFLTIEGNSDQEGSPNGFEACARSRAYRRADFVLLA